MRGFWARCSKTAEIIPSILNNGVYTKNSVTSVNCDLGQVYNSQKITETSELFAILPIGMVV